MRETGGERLQLLTPAPGRCSLEEAYTRCIRLARTHYENFTVGSWLLPRGALRHVCAVYAFCRFVDDLGDEVPGDRLAQLDLWEGELHHCYVGQPSHPYMIALQHTIRTFDIPPEPFLKLVQANRMDQTNRRHATYQDLLYYCDHSANPVGHLFLYLFGYRDVERQRLADSTCTALQLANFWQDVRRDMAKGRIYIPVEDMARFGYTEGQLQQGMVNQEFRRLMAFEVERARELFRLGLRLLELVRGTVKVDIKLFSLGGMSLLDAIERQGYDVLSRRPVVGRGRRLWLLFKTLAQVKLLGR